MGYRNEKLWKQGSNGIYYAEGIDTSTAFSDEAEKRLMDVEDSSWWFQYRANVIVSYMQKYFSQNLFTVDIGGGNAYTSSVAKKKGYLTAVIEPSPGACLNAKRRRIHEVNCGAVTDKTINDESIDQVLLLDVLEHIEDDEAFLKLLRKKMVKGGKIIVTVPAFMSLWSSEDREAGHFRRYRSDEVCRLLGRNGFKILYRNYFMSFLYIPILVIRVGFEKIGILKKQEDRSDEEKEKVMNSQFRSTNPIVNTVLGFFEDLEEKLMKKSGLVPFGSSIIVVARRK